MQFFTSLSAAYSYGLSVPNVETKAYSVCPFSEKHYNNS